MNERRTLVLGAAAAGVFWVALFAFGAARPTTRNSRKP